MKFLTLALLLGVSLNLIHAGWTPPSNPDPNTILQEAQRDAEEGKFEDALAKQVWFHENADKLRPALYGVRLSFALTQWAQLAAAYPPALAKLEAVRDASGEEVRKGGATARRAFHDFDSINEQLGDSTRTKDLFVWLDKQKPDLAKQVSDLAQPALIRAKEYKLAGQYLNPAGELERRITEFQQFREQSGKAGFDERLKPFSEKRFTNSISTLVALLVLNDRKEEAAKVAEAASRIWEDPKFLEALKQAWEGTVPEPWP